MKKNVIGQIVLLLLTILLGSILKGDLESGARLFHRVFALLAVLTGIAVVANAFMQQQTSKVKILSVITLLLTLSAGMGGMATQTGENYSRAFSQMTISATLAFVLSVVTYFQIKSSTN